MFWSSKIPGTLADVGFFGTHRLRCSFLKVARPSSLVWQSSAPSCPGGDPINGGSARVSRPRRLLDRRSPAGLGVEDLRSAKWQGQETLPQLGLDCENSGKLFPARSIPNCLVELGEIRGEQVLRLLAIRQARLEKS